MNNQDKKMNFFCGVNKASGFCNKFFQFFNYKENENCYIIKGGSGCGKSTLMKKIADKLTDKGHTCYLFNCSADPDSLDGVYCKELKFIIVDGTSPHVIEPKYPVAHENIVSLFSCIKSEKIKPKIDEIVNLSLENKKYHERNRYLLSAISSILNDTEKLISPHCDIEKINKYTKNLTNKLFKNKLNKKSSEKQLFLSAVTLNGLQFFSESVKKIANNIYEFQDPYGTVTVKIIENIKAAAKNAGYDVISCLCPLSEDDKIEHLLIPELSIGFITTNKFKNLGDYKPYRRIQAKRFLNLKEIAENKNRINFNKKAIEELIKEIKGQLKKAKEIHIKLEEIYVNSIDFKEIDIISNNLISDIQKLKK